MTTKDGYTPMPKPTKKNRTLKSVPDGDEGPIALKAEGDDRVSLSGRIKPRCTPDPDNEGGVILKDVPLYTPLLMDDDLSPLLVQFGLNPEKFEVIKDTWSMWMQSASSDSGRDLVYLYSGKFRKIGQVEEETSNREFLDKMQSVLIKDRRSLKKPKYKASAGTPCTWAAWPTDLQLGKTRTPEAIHNFKTGITDWLEEGQRLIDSGVPIEGVHIGWGGDETEGVANNYHAQSAKVELNQSEQLELDATLRIWAIDLAAELGLPISASSVISNHGEWTRNGSKDVETSKSDNSSTHVARDVQRLYNRLAKHTGWNVDWTIGGKHSGDGGLVIELSGEKVYSSHGHIEKGRGGSTELRTKNAIEKQLLGDILAERRLIDIRLFLMAHYHHFYSIEDRGRIVVGLPALEAERSSEYMEKQFGVWSPPGMVGMTVGKFDKRPFRHLNVFGRDYVKQESGLIVAAA